MKHPEKRPTLNVVQAGFSMKINETLLNFSIVVPEL